MAPKRVVEKKDEGTPALPDLVKFIRTPSSRINKMFPHGEGGWSTGHPSESDGLSSKKQCLMEKNLRVSGTGEYKTSDKRSTTSFQKPCVVGSVQHRHEAEGGHPSYVAAQELDNIGGLCIFE